MVDTVKIVFVDGKGAIENMAIGIDDYAVDFLPNQTVVELERASASIRELVHLAAGLRASVVRLATRPYCLTLEIKANSASAAVALLLLTARKLSMVIMWDNGILPGIRW